MANLKFEFIKEWVVTAAPSLYPVFGYWVNTDRRGHLFIVLRNVIGMVYKIEQSFFVYINLM
jgi:hypothetical protein